MTRFYVNDKEITPPMDTSSLGQILKEVENAHLPPNVVVRKIQIDGLPLLPQIVSENPAALCEQMERSEKVEIFTGTLAEIAGDSIREALAYLRRIEDATPSLAESFRFSPNPDAFENLRQLCEGFYWLNLLIDKLGTNFQLRLEEMIVGGIPAMHHHQKFISVLKQLVESQESGDFILIADLLEYEILPLVPVWKEMFGSIAEKMVGTQ
ncbi:MAG: hypothetical protein JXA73_26965 [Acidobacteria bacterium]|nr:hypothetical protein [Acidobacteriota bacterium]